MIDIDLLKRAFKYRVNNSQQGKLSLDGLIIYKSKNVGTRNSNY